MSNDQPAGRLGIGVGLNLGELKSDVGKMQSILNEGMAGSVKATNLAEAGFQRYIASLEKATQRAGKTAEELKKMEIAARAMAAEQQGMVDVATKIRATGDAYIKAKYGMDAVTASAGQQRAGMQQLSFQIGDVAQQFALGTNPMIIFAQQGGQVVQAMSMMRGGAGGLIGFLAGPWGAAIMGASMIVGTLAMKFMESRDKAKEGEKAYKSLADQLDRNKSSYDEVIAAVAEYNRQQDKAAELTIEQTALVARAAAANIREARSEREKIAAKLESAKLSEEIAAQQGGDGIAQALAMRRVARLEADMAANAAKLTELAGEARRAVVGVATEMGRLDSDPTEQLRAGFRMMRNEAVATIKDVNVLAARLAEINRQEAAATSARGAGSRGSRGPGLAPVTMEEVARRLGAPIISGLRSASTNRRVGGAANSYHLTGQAIDIPITVNGRPMTKDGIRAALNEAGIIIKELLGPGDKGHADHFHIAFDRKRATPDQVMRDVARATAAAAKEAEKLEQLLQGAQDHAAGIIVAMGGSGDLYERLGIDLGEGIKAIDRTEEALGDLDRMQADFKAAQEERTQGAIDEAEAAARLRDEYDELAGILGAMGGGGRTIGKALNFLSGNYAAIGGRTGAMLELFNRQSSGGLKDIGKDFHEALDRFFGGDGEFTKAMQAGGLGVGIGSMALGSRGSDFGSFAGGILGKEFGESVLGPMMGELASFAGPVGTIIGSVLGGLIGGAFKKTKTGSATIGAGDYGLAVTGTGGNSASRKQAASGMAGNVIGALEQIAEQLGGTADGPISVSVGIRNKKFRVDTSGSGRTKKGAGVLDFGKDEAAAVKAAIADAIADGALTGLSESVVRLLKAGDIERQLPKAQKFSAAMLDLLERTDPLAAAFDGLSREFEQLARIAEEAGASAEEQARLQQLLRLRQDEALEEARKAAIEKVSEQRNLEIRALELLGREQDAVAAMRELELAGLKDSLRPLQQMVYQLEDARKVLDTFGPLAEDLRAYRAELLGGSAIADSFGFLSAQFRSTAALAASGDAGAMGQLRGTAGAFLAAAMDNAGSDLDYRRAVGEVLASVDRGIFAADAQADFAQAQIDAIDRNAAILTSISDRLQVSQTQIAENTAKLARLWERFENDGLTVKTDADTPLYIVETLP